MKGSNIDKLIDALTQSVKLVEKQIDSKTYTTALLDYIKVTETKAFRFLYRGGINPSNDEEIAGKQLLLLEAIQYILKLFPSYYEEVQIGLKTNNEFFHIKSNTEDLQFIEKLLPKINLYITKDSTIEDWKDVLENKEPNRCIEPICTNKLLGEFIAELKRKRQLSNADRDFGKYFGKKPRFLEVATLSRITEKNKDILKEIFTAVQK